MYIHIIHTHILYIIKIFNTDVNYVNNLISIITVKRLTKV